jgi:hypothetical protein
VGVHTAYGLDEQKATKIGCAAKGTNDIYEESPLKEILNELCDINDHGNYCRSQRDKNIDSRRSGRAEARLHGGKAESAVEGPEIILALDAFQRNDEVLDEIGDPDACRIHTCLQHLEDFWKVSERDSLGEGNGHGHQEQKLKYFRCHFQPFCCLVIYLFEEIRHTFGAYKLFIKKPPKMSQNILQRKQVF